ncbi:MAG: lipopolysaccharide biosynthesis protein [Candidatus Sifarchaeia archaeon]
MASTENKIDRDRYSINLVAESVSRVLSFVGGLISTVILWRSINAGFWTTDEYGIIKVLSNANAALLPLVLLGINGAIVRVSAEYSTDQKKIGRVVGLGILLITVTYLITSLTTIFFGLDQVLLVSALDVGVGIDELRYYWFLVLITMLPTAYLRISKSVFSGLQQSKRTTYIDILYSSTRIFFLLLFFISGFISINFVLLLNLGLALLAGSAAIFQLAYLMRGAGIKWDFTPEKSILRKMGRLAAVGLATSLVAAVSDNVTVLWINSYGTLTDVGFFSIAQGISLTARMVLASSMATLVPNLTYEFEFGRIDRVKTKFREACRMTVPSYTFMFAVLFAFASHILRVMYGADSSGAGIFLQVLSFNLSLMTVPGIYTSLFLVLDNLKAMIYASTLQVIFTILWVVIFTPIIGIIAIAMIWVVYVPYFVIVHQYAKRKHDITMQMSNTIGSILLGFVFAVLMYYTQLFVHPFIQSLNLLNIIDAMIVISLVIPFWYFFIAIATVTGLLYKKDLANIESVFRIIRPAWWISKPIIQKLATIAKEHPSESVELESE